MPFCYKCGQSVLEGASFCGACGTQVIAPNAAPVGPGPGAPAFAAPGYPYPARPVQNNNQVVLIVCALVFGGIFFVAILAAILVPNFIRARAQGQVTACKSNLKNIGTALEMWSTDNQGRFPDALGQLAPNYLKRIPTCPSCGADTYSRGFQSFNPPPARGPDGRDRYLNAYTVECTGQNHTGVGLRGNFPQYNSTQGLVDR